jgi:hypothetical protein
MEMQLSGHTINSPNDLGKVLGTRQNGKKIMIIREYGIETLQTAIDPSRFRLQVTMRTPRKIINLRQVEYLLKKRGAK